MVLKQVVQPVVLGTQSNTAPYLEVPQPRGREVGRGSCHRLARPCGHLCGQPAYLTASFSSSSRFCHFHFLPALHRPLEGIHFSTMEMS